MRRFLTIALTITISGSVWAKDAGQKQPVYVGARVCAKCHEGKGMGHQYSKWLASKHAQAYGVLAQPESKKIAQLSGIPQEPQEAAMCLGCHATGAHAEAWEKDPTFSVLDGVQCEKCHGPGSEYVDVSLMTNKEAAIKSGLTIPTIQDCMNCHFEKGSHVAMLKLPKIDMEKAFKDIAHPTPENYEIGRISPLPPANNQQKDMPKYVGVFTCAGCHNSPSMGYRFSKWRTSAHARAYATLASDKAYEIAKKEGLKEDPQTSPQCLKCHTGIYYQPASGANESYGLDEGIGCETCHGAGSAYALEAIMRDRPAARAAGLKDVTQEICQSCHESPAIPESLKKRAMLDNDKTIAEIAHPPDAQKVGETPLYKTPLNIAISPDAKILYIACEASNTVIVVDVQSRQKVGEIAVGRQPNDVTFSPDGKRAYVSHRLDDSVAVIDVAAGKVIATVAVGDEPHGVLTDASGKYLYVANSSSDSISVIDTATLKEVKRLSASRGPWSLSLSADKRLIYVTHTLSRFVKFREPPVSEVTVIDANSAVVEERFLVPSANLLQGVSWHPGGDFGLVTLMRTKSNVPMTRLLQGWTITNGLGIIWKNGRVDQVLLDEPGLCFPDPADVAITPDGRFAFVTSSGSNRVAVVDIGKLISMLETASEYDRKHIFPNHLGKSTEFVISHIPTEHGPRGITIAPDGKTAFVANALDDSLTAIDIERLEVTGRLDLGGPEVVTTARYGERLFNSANITFHRQFSCHSCHPDGHIDGITYDIEPDGIGISPVDNRTLRGILDTAPFKWEGTNPSLQRQCGPRLSVFFTRIQPFTPEELSAVDNYICTIPRPPNRYRPLGAELTEAQRRGKGMFERKTTNDGRAIPKDKRCATCHSPPLYTDRLRHDVGTKMWLDRQGKFDTPHLNNIYDSAPYLHNGICDTLEEIWTRYNPTDRHGVTNDMTKDQLNDLIEFIKTL